MNRKVYRKNLIFRTQTINDRCILFGNREAFELNEVAEFIWKNIDGYSNLDEICEKVALYFDVSETENSIEADVIAFVLQMEEAGTIFEIVK